ncbi:hypothetical protein OIY81_492 [Cryptosporidium canis]|uniref:Uncharacterized protein n=1 Tax=Cryptosporidium canis TaxID=195482 RepID=A0ABQ8P9I6_9CRYT|nr:hypothetical protein OJ252_1830 [Cryptosporidium canis]KAJ1614438.1 hypothetical protein OIY81_492 [Cryptosporidium canis]
MDREVNKFMLQINTHWGDPLYTANSIGSGRTLTYETWEYANSRSKSIGILLEVCNSDETNVFPICLTLYSSGKLLNAVKCKRIPLSDFVKLFMTGSMLRVLNILPLNYGNILFLDELLFLVERGSLLLFSWSKSRLDWIQTPILYLFNAFIKNQELFKLSNFISYSRMRRSGNKFAACSDKEDSKIQEEIETGKRIVSCIDIEQRITLGICTWSIKTLSSVDSKSDSYLATSLKTGNKKNKLPILSKQPYERFLIRSETGNVCDHFILSIVSINSEIRLKVSPYIF